MARDRRVGRPGTRERKAEQVSPAASARGGAFVEWIGIAACAAVALLAFIFSFNKLDDFDTWWHLAAGRWIATHGSVPPGDTLSHTVRGLPWINLQWGFDLGLYLLHKMGGPVALCAAGAIAFTAAIVLILRLMARHLGGSLASLVGLIVVLAAQGRVALRPELLSFVLLAGVLSVLEREQVRRTDFRLPIPDLRLPISDSRLPMFLVPLMIAWANVHSLFVIGAFAIVCAFVSQLAVPPRRLLLWGGVALVGVLVNPFGFTGALFPLTLLSRISGSTPVFQTIGEFASPFAAGATGLDLVFYQIVLALGCAAAAWAMFRRPRGARFDWGGFVFFAGLAALSMAARRNVALFAIGAAPFIAQCLGAALAASPGIRGRLTRLAPFTAAIVILAATLLGAAEITGALPRWDRQPREFGAGIIEGTFPIRAAAFAREAKLPGKLYNDMSSGGYLSWDDPIGDGVFVDGRLEVYDTPFLTEFVTAMSEPARWQQNADRYGVQTAIIFHRFEDCRLLIGKLIQDTAWTLVYSDEVAAIFVRTVGNSAAITRAALLRPQQDAETDRWLSRPAAKWPYPAGRVEGTRAYARFLATIGRADPSVAAYLKFLDLGVSEGDEIDTRLLLAKFFASRGRSQEAREQAFKVLAIDPTNAAALAAAR